LNKRAFIKNVSIAGSSFAAGAVFHKYFFPSEAANGNAPLGEEWKNKRKRNEKDLTGLLEDKDVLKNAQERIEKYRKATFNLQFQNPDQTPFAQKEITLQLKRHEVDWGCSAAGSAQLLVKDEKHRLRGEKFAALFDCTTAKCYWEERWHQPIERYRGRRIYDLFLDEIKWAESLGLKVKGHPLIWTVPKAIPKWLHNYNYEDQLNYLKNHVQALIYAAGPSVQLWDLCNEMLWEPAFKNIAKREWPHIDPIEDIAEYIANGLEWAREVNPNAVYSLNDYGLIYTYRAEISAEEQRERYLQLIDALREKGYLPDAVGCQSHVGGRYQLGAFEKTLQHLAQAGLPVQVTEFWAQEKDFPDDLPKEEKQKQIADYICQMYTVGFSIPELNHFTYWGSRAFFDENNEPTYAYKQLHYLIKNEWTTKLTGMTNEKGEMTFQGFKGTYEVKIGEEETTLTAFDLNDESEQVITIF